MAVQGDGQKGTAGRSAGPADVPRSRLIEQPGAIELPAYVLRTLESSVGTRPERRAIELVPRPDDRVARRLREAGVVQRDLRLRGADDSPRAARCTEQLINALALHTQHDLRLPPGRCEAMAQALGYLFWFQRRFGERGPLELTAPTVASCFGNYYIRRGGRGAATFAAFLARAGWWTAEDAGPVLALADEGPWFRERLQSYWTSEGDGWHDWLAEADPLSLCRARASWSPTATPTAPGTRWTPGGSRG